MSWKKGKVRFDDGSEYPADLLINDKGQVWNIKVHKADGVVEEIDADAFARKLNKKAEDVYPYTYTIED